MNHFLRVLILVSAWQLHVAAGAQAQPYVNEIIITNFQIDGSSGPLKLEPTRTVTFTMNLSKPQDHHGYVYVDIYLGTASGPGGSDTRLTYGSTVPPGLATCCPTVDGWVPGNNGRDTYVVDANHPNSNTGKSFSTGTSLFSSHPEFTYIYVVLTNINSTNYADPGARRGVSQGIKIDRTVTPPCVSDVSVQNVDGLTGTVSAGRDLYAGTAVMQGTTGPVNVRGVAAFTARGTIAIMDGFSAVQGSTFSAFPDASVCSTARPATAGPKVPHDIADTPSPDDPSSHYLDRTSTVANVVGPEGQTPVIYPNPVRDELTLTLAGTGAAARTVVVYDSRGAEVQRVIIPTGQVKLDTRALPAGIYYLRTGSGTKTVNIRFSKIQ